MKKVITIVCLAAAPIIFAQEKASKAAEKEAVKSEQASTKVFKEQDPHAKKKVQAEKNKKTATKTKSGVSNKQSETLEANPAPASQSKKK